MKHYIKRLLRESLISEEKLSDEELNQLKELVQSGQDDNIKLAFMIASGHGEGVENELFTYWYNQSVDKQTEPGNKTWDDLKKLTKFNIANFDIRNNHNSLIIPDTIGKLTNLRELILAFNSIEKIPSSIGNLTNLKWLNLMWNGLEELPDSIKYLKNLEYLGLVGNKLITLPKSIDKLTNLKKLNLQVNPISASEKERIKKLLPNTIIL